MSSASQLLRVLAVSSILGCAACTSVADPLASENPENPEREAYGEWLKQEIAGTVCSDGSQYKFFANYSDTSDNLLIFFEPGGACWDYESCRPGGSQRGAVNPAGITDFHAAIWEAFMPLISRSTAESSFQDWNFVFMPYCTGDVFAGDEVVTYEDPAGVGDPIEFQHKGHRNMVAAMDWLADHFTYVPKLFVSGVSAGGVGALVNYGFIREALPSVGRGYLLDDSGPFFPMSDNSRPLYDKVKSSWRVSNWLPEADLTPGFDVSDLGSINAAYADAYPNDRIANTFFRRDYNFSLYSYETFFDFPPKETIHQMWWQDAEKLIAQAETRDNLAYYIPYHRELNCSHGTLLLEQAGTEVEAEGVDVGDFIAQLIDDDAPLQSYLEAEQLAEDVAAKPDCEMTPTSP